MSSKISASTTSGTALNFSADTSGILEIQTGATPTTAITVDASQNVGIGTSSPLSVTGSTYGWRVLQLYSSTDAAMIVNGNGGASRLHLTSGVASTNQKSWAVQSYNGALQFLSVADNLTSSEVGRFDSSGNLLVNRTSSLSAGWKVQIDCTNGVSTGLVVNATATASTDAVYFRNPNGVIGGVTVSATSTTFNTSSDQRLKEDKGISTDISVIDNTIIHDFAWKMDGSLDRGVFAQEAQKVKPSAVKEGADEFGENGLLTNPWGVDYSKYVPDIIVYCQQLKKSIQEQQVMIEELKAKVAALEAK